MSSSCRTFCCRRACLRGRGLLEHVWEPAWERCRFPGAAGSCAGRRLLRLAAGRDSARWGAATERRRCACSAAADRESVEFGRFATSYLYPSSFALRLIVFLLGLHYSDYLVVCGMETVAFKRAGTNVPPARLSGDLPNRTRHILHRPKVLPGPGRCRPWPSRAALPAARGLPTA